MAPYHKASQVDPNPILRFNFSSDQRQIQLEIEEFSRSLKLGISIIFEFSFKVSDIFLGQVGKITFNQTYPTVVQVNIDSRLLTILNLRINSSENIDRAPNIMLIHLEAVTISRDFALAFGISFLLAFTMMATIYAFIKRGYTIQGKKAHESIELDADDFSDEHSSYSGASTISTNLDTISSKSATSSNFTSKTWISRR
jgi:DNA-binding XRE family transcriptional regulator